MCMNSDAAYRAMDRTAPPPPEARAARFLTELAEEIAGPFALADAIFPSEPAAPAPAPKPMMRVYGQIIAQQRTVRNQAPRSWGLVKAQWAIREIVARLPVVRDNVPSTPPVGPDYLSPAFLSKLNGKRS